MQNLYGGSDFDDEEEVLFGESNPNLALKQSSEELSILYGSSTALTH